jgi:gliding motility-associated-like protein
MKKKLKTYKIYLLLIYLITLKVNAQVNLVPNPSFESYTACPSTFAIFSLQNWYSPTQGTPDYFNACNTNSFDVSTPINYFGTQTPKTGSSYVGFVVSFNPSDPSYREYVQVQLTSGLIAGEKYIVSSYISLADSMPLAIKNIGMALSTNSIGGNFVTSINFTPQVIYSQFLSDTGSWVKISDTIVANGGEDYLTIGYFKPNNNTDTLSLYQSSTNFGYSYYYLDDVSITLLSPNSVEEFSINNPIVFSSFITPNNDGTDDFILLTNDNIRVKNFFIYDVFGRIIFNKTNQNKFLWDGKNSNHNILEDGIYYYMGEFEIGNNKKIIKRGSIILKN